MNHNNYEVSFSKYQKTGVRPAVIFTEPGIAEEQYLLITDQHINGIYPDRYYISNYGNAFDSLSGKYLSQSFDKDGYKRVSFCTETGYITVRVHRIELVVFQFRLDFKRLQVNHIDGDPSNNMITNLEWVTPKENSDHAMLYNFHKMNGTDNPNNKLSENQVHEICKLIETGNYYDTEIAKMYNVSYANISDIHKGKIWTSISRNYDLSKRKSLSLRTKKKD